MFMSQQVNKNTDNSKEPTVPNHSGDNLAALNNSRTKDKDSDKN